MQQHKGALVCVGSGIKGIGQMTLEAVNWIEEADVVCHNISDPVTIVWLKQHAKAHDDLAECYRDGLPRMQAYEQMAERMLSFVRDGKLVCSVFYGHPGLFVYPTHLAIATARKSGYKAWMLPGVSAFDCLISDVGFDPSQMGSILYEATDMLIRRRPLHPDTYLVIWQVGVIGEISSRFRGLDHNRNADRLMDYLLSVYPPDHRVVHYQGSQYAICSSEIEFVRLADLASCRFSAISTLLVPPAHVRATDEALCREIGFAAGAKGEKPPEGDTRPAKVSSYVKTPDQSGAADFINRLATSPRLLSRFERSREEVIGELGGVLSSDERTVLAACRPDEIREIVKRGAHANRVQG